MIELQHDPFDVDFPLQKWGIVAPDKLIGRAFGDVTGYGLQVAVYYDIWQRRFWLVLRVVFEVERPVNETAFEHFEQLNTLLAHILIRQMVNPTERPRIVAVIVEKAAEPVADIPCERLLPLIP